MTEINKRKGSRGGEREGKGEVLGSELEQDMLHACIITSKWILSYITKKNQ